MLHIFLGIGTLEDRIGNVRVTYFYVDVAKLLRQEMKLKLRFR